MSFEAYADLPQVVSRQAATEWPLCLGVGAGFLFAVPVAAALLCITLIGIPLGLLAILLYAVVLLLGHCTGKKLRVRFLVDEPSRHRVTVDHSHNGCWLARGACNGQKQRAKPESHNAPARA